MDAVWQKDGTLDLGGGVLRLDAAPTLLTDGCIPVSLTWECTVAGASAVAPTLRGGGAAPAAVQRRPRLAHAASPMRRRQAQACR